MIVLWVHVFDTGLAENVFVVNTLKSQHRACGFQCRLHNFSLQEYQAYLGESGEHLSLTVDLLDNTACLCELFTSPRTIKSNADPLIVNAEKALNWFKMWEKEIQSDSELSKKEKWRALISWECREDLESAVVGFQQLVKIRTKAFPGSGIKPQLINTDCVENVFCQVRACHNGANTNPTYLQYLYTLNTVMLSAGIFKKNSNAGESKIAPFAFSTPCPLNPKKKTNLV